MDDIRLVYEQIEEAKRYLLSNSPLQLRLAFILLDNVAEVLMYRALDRQFAHDDAMRPFFKQAAKFGVPLDGGLRIRYTTKERENSTRHYDGMTALLRRLDRISADERTILDKCHTLRRDLFHRAFLRSEILTPTAALLFKTVVSLTKKLKAQSIGGPINEEQAAFLRRYGLESLVLLIDDRGVTKVAEQLLDGIPFDAQEFAATLSKELAERIEHTIEAIEEIVDPKNDEDTDMVLNHSEFHSVNESAIERAIADTGLDGMRRLHRDWIHSGNGQFRIGKIRSWHRVASKVAEQLNPASALSIYLAIEKQFSPSEEKIWDIVGDYESWVDSEIDRIRGK